MKNESTKKQLRFLIMWSALNLLGWIIGFIFVFTISYNLLTIKQFAVAHDWVADYRSEWEEWPGVAALVGFPFGLSIGILQWIKLRQFRVKPFVWAFITAIGCSILAALFSGTQNVDWYGLSFCPIQAVLARLYHLGGGCDFLGWIFSFWLSRIGLIGTAEMMLDPAEIGFVAVLLIGGAIIGALQSVVIRKNIPKPEFWIGAYVVGLLVPVIIAPLTVLVKSILLKFCYFFHLHFLVSLRWELFWGFVIIITCMSISISTGAILLMKQSGTDSIYYQKGKRLAVKSTFVGSIVFSLMFWVHIYARAHLIFKTTILEYVTISPAIPINTFTTIYAATVATIVMALLAIAFAYFPARFMGGRLANSLEADIHNQLSLKKGAILKGAEFGAIAGCMICIPLWVLELIAMVITPYYGVDIIPALLLSCETIIIASITGGWTGRRLERLMSQ